MKEALKRIKNSPKPPVVNAKLKIQLEKIVKKLIAREYRDEALKILFKSDSKKIGEFLYYYNSDIGNVACMVIDSAKNDLVKAGKMKQNKKDHFGIDFKTLTPGSQRGYLC